MKMHYPIPVLMKTRLFKEQVLACDVRVSIVSGVVGRGGCKSIPAWSSRTEAGRINRGPSRANFDDRYFLRVVVFAFLPLRLPRAFSLTLDLGPAGFAK